MIDPSIIAGLVRPEWESPLAPQMRALNLRQMANQVKAQDESAALQPQRTTLVNQQVEQGQLGIDQARLKKAQEEAAIASQKAYTDAMTEADGDPDKMEAAFRKANLTPEHRVIADQHVAEAKNRRASMTATQQKQHQDYMDRIASGMYGVYTTPEEQRGPAFKALMTEAMQATDPLTGKPYATPDQFSMDVIPSTDEIKTAGRVISRSAWDKAEADAIKVKDDAEKRNDTDKTREQDAIKRDLATVAQLASGLDPKAPDFQQQWDTILEGYKDSPAVKFFPKTATPANLASLVKRGVEIGKQLTEAGKSVDKTVSETELALAVARGKSPTATPEDVAKGVEAEAALKRLDQSKREGRPPAAVVPGSTPDDPKDISDAIVAGRQPPTLTGLYRNASAVRANLARAKYPDGSPYDLARAQSDWTAVQKHLATLNGAQQERLRQAITFTYDSIPIIEDLYDKWQKTGLPSGFKVWNKAALVASSHLPGEAGSIASNLLSQVNDLTSEMGTVYKGGNSSTDESLKLAASNLNADWNEKTFKDAIKRMKTNLQIRKNSINTSAPAGVSPDSPYVSKPTAVESQAKDPLGIR